MSRSAPLAYSMRLTFLLALLVLIVLALVWRAVDLQVRNRDFLQDQGDARHLRALTMPAHRGMITDRNGEPLAISTPVDSVWANPKELALERERWRPLARLLGMDVAELRDRIMQRADREFVYLKRHVDPALAQRVMALEIPGVSLQREYRRYYPLGEVAAHLVGFTNIDDAGQEGIELAYENWLRGTSGSKWVLKDRLGHVVENVAGISEPDPGKDLALSIDNRIQYLAYRELKAAVQLHRARSGSAVVLDVATGEVVAMVNQPSYNPNNREGKRGELLRNRAVTDLFEPGSTVKPFTVAAALESGKYHPGTYIDTAPGFYKIGRHLVRDNHNYGYIDITTVIEKSSNVGSSKIALALEPARMWKIFSGVGFGQPTGGSFPGEVTGLLPDYRGWKEIERATLSFGYGLSVTPLQLTLAYAVLGDKGRLKPVSFVPVGDTVESRVVMSEKTAAEVVRMMETVVSEQGTANLAKVAGYRVAGKTGTVQKLGAEGYSDQHYVAVFAGVAPASNPRLAMVVVINEPRGEEYYGGLVAAPVFSRVMTGALRVLGMLPDELPRLRQARTAPDAGAVSAADESFARPVVADGSGIM
jgi:cell division protein FtsI (penicillin-binding protein 3)